MGWPSPALKGHPPPDNSVGMTAGPADPQTHDLTDDAGHGVLVASDKLWFFISNRYSINNTGTGAGASTAIIRVLYRFKSVGLTEYIGLVQSQSQVAGV